MSAATSGPTTGPEPVLAVRGLDVGVHDLGLVHDVSFAVGRGERVGLIGESGSGKSLTGLSLLGLLPEDVRATGSVRLAGVDHDLVGASERQLAAVRGRQVAMVFQEPMTALDPTMRVGDQVAEALLVHRTVPDRGTARRRAVELLDRVRLPDPGQAARAYPHQLSGGQRQRVVLAIALADDPALLVCDEPTTALDVTVQALVLDLVVRGVQERDAALLLITHDLAVVATACERVLVMYGGRIVEAGPVEQVFTRPRHRYTQGLVAASDLSVTDERGRPVSIPGSVPPAGLFPPGCVFRTRCAHADATCEERPGWTPYGPGEGDGGFACHHPAPASETSAAPATTVSDAARSATETSERSAATATDPSDAAGVGVSVRDVVRDYRRPRRSLRQPGPVVRALRGVSLRVEPGERFGVVGESGCGKSTLLRLLAGLDRPTSGTVELTGADGPTTPGRREQPQLVFQDPTGSLDPRMRVRDVVAEPLLATTRDRAAREARVAELLEQVGLPREAGDRFPHQFSGGQRQRISIARALAPRPGLLLADEPVSALDVSVRAQVLGLLADLVDELRVTLVLVSHDLSVVRHLCDRVAVMSDGEVVETGPTEQVWSDPQHPYTRRLLAAVPSMERALAGAGTRDLAAAELDRLTPEPAQEAR
ncbi:dipeptide ABC transporter ATP-binding protein [Lapillicoccus jejuensis]|uniref:Peptide/nickel transport system ATP-binding protein/peptide/nickel transport system ATP-binding protein n=1 Tax=Lapillicoccus jejuensis TaxID=402171 RepID=A0A542E6V8_9MICO|nr:ABC transporter ATP-binding protein [Lapillicoccus jejuensis]TQJ11060.1 peptide/nickel transport system ATP-binding protein/peptide/nickel transport system ATP-binding protein [Lapillicoccus jejuensis]